MKKILSIFLLSTLLFGADNDLRLESRIYYAIAKELTHKIKPQVYMQSNISSIKKFSSNFIIVDKCTKADIIFVTYLKEIQKECEGKIFFGSRHKTLQKEQTIGAFFWQKGRPNILFYKSRLEQYGIELNQHFKKYIDNEK